MSPPLDSLSNKGGIGLVLPAIASGQLPPRTDRSAYPYGCSPVLTIRVNRKFIQFSFPSSLTHELCGIDIVGVTQADHEEVYVSSPYLTSRHD
jgi:hypothetical protein